MQLEEEDTVPEVSAGTSKGRRVTHNADLGKYDQFRKKFDRVHHRRTTESSGPCVA